MEWLLSNGEVGDVGDSGDGGNGERRVVGIKAGDVETQFCVELSSGEAIHCYLPQCYSHRAGVSLAKCL